MIFQQWILVICLVFIDIIQCSNFPYRAIHISSGGVYFWYQAGCLSYIQKKYDVNNVIVVGSSAGALAATLLKCGCDFKSSADIAIKLCDKENVWQAKLGLFGIWGRIVQQWLNELILENVTGKQLGNLYICVTPFPNIFHRPKFLSMFTSKDDVISACLSSIHIPYFMNKKLLSKYKNTKYIDGSFYSVLPFLRFRYNNEKEKLFKSLKIANSEVLNIDWRSDIEFRKKYSQYSVISLLKPSTVYDMMNAGSCYMEKLLY